MLRIVMKSQTINNWYDNIDVIAYDGFSQYHPIIAQIRHDTEQIKDQERKFAILSNLTSSAIIFWILTML